MVSILSQSTLTSLEERQPIIQERFKECQLGTLHDAIKPFTQQIVSAGNSTVRLHCTLPTWCPSSVDDTCVDLYDLHNLRAKYLVFIHDLVQSLRSSGVTASYCLAPSSSNSSVCLVCAMPPELDSSRIRDSALGALQAANLKTHGVLLTDLDHCPSLIIS